MKNEGRKKEIDQCNAFNSFYATVEDCINLPILSEWEQTSVGTATRLRYDRLKMVVHYPIGVSKLLSLLFNGWLGFLVTVVESASCLFNWIFRRS
jgi:hypothetical protein